MFRRFKTRVTTNTCQATSLLIVFFPNIQNSSTSSDQMESETELNFSSYEDNPEQSPPVGRRSLRISTRHRQQEQILANRPMVDSEDDSDSLPRRPGRPRTKQIHQTLASSRN